MHMHQEAQAVAPFPDALPHGDRAARALGLILLLQGHVHTLGAEDRTRSRLMRLISYWRLILDISGIERERATHDRAVLEALEQDHDADLLALLARNARSIASSLGACTFADLTGLTLLLPPCRTPALSHLH